MSSPAQRKNGARNVEIAGTGVAATVGARLGAAKLRDSFREDYPDRFAHGVTHLHSAALRAGASPHTAGKLLHVAEHGRPGFKSLAVATTAGVTAAGAKRYQQLQDVKIRRAQRRRAERRLAQSATAPPEATMSTSAFGVPLAKLDATRFTTPKAREKAAAKHDALPDGSFPIQNRSQLMRARHAIGRSKHPDAARALIRRRADQLGVSLKGSAIGGSGVTKAVTTPGAASTPTGPSMLKRLGAATVGGGVLGGGAVLLAQRGKTGQPVAGMTRTISRALPAAGMAKSHSGETTMAISAFGVAHEPLAKFDAKQTKDRLARDYRRVSGSPGDKRNTKYAGSAYAGLLAGAGLSRGNPAVSALGAAYGAAAYHQHRGTIAGAKGIHRSRTAAARHKQDVMSARVIRDAPVSLTKSAFGVPHQRQDRTDKIQRAAPAALTAGAVGAGSAAAQSRARAGGRLAQSTANPGHADFYVARAAEQLKRARSRSVAAALLAGSAVGAASTQRKARGSRTVTAKSAFGVAHEPLAKANTNTEYASPERLATAAVFPGFHAALAGRRGKKLRAGGNEVLGASFGSVVPGPGTLAGGAVGAALAHRKGYYKPDRGSQRTRPLFGDAR